MPKPPRSPRASAGARYDFHSHTYLTDGRASAGDMWHRAELLGHRALAITDHVGANDPAPLLKVLAQEAEGVAGLGLRPVVGVELTMLRPERIAAAARRARRSGAEIVIVHGETPVEPVYPGTNRAAIDCAEVDLLAHPGLLRPADAELARAHGVVIELSGRRGHSLTNGHVAATAMQAGCELVVDSDAHRPEDLLDLPLARTVARGAGVPPARLTEILRTGPERLLSRLSQSA